MSAELLYRKIILLPCLPSTTDLTLGYATLHGGSGLPSPKTGRWQLRSKLQHQNLSHLVGPTSDTFWIRRFERFRIASGLSEKDEKMQVNTLIYFMADQADKILTSFSSSVEQSVEYDTVKDKFDGHFVKCSNVIYERTKFNMRKQKDREPIDSLITDLHTLVQHCNYGLLREEMICNRIIV